MGRARRTRLWIALPGGIAINGLLLALLVLVERAPPRLEEPQILTLALERPQRERQPRRRAPTAPSIAQAGRPSPAAASAPAVAGPAGEAAPAVAAPPAIEPAWRLSTGAIERWRITEGNPAFFWGRYYRACKGLSSEHMTDEEKDRCYGGWREAEKRMDARFGDALAQPPPSRYDRDAAHQERRRAYRSKRTPGNTTSGSSLHFPGVSDGVPLSQRGCF